MQLAQKLDPSRPRGGGYVNDGPHEHSAHRQGTMGIAMGEAKPSGVQQTAFADEVELIAQAQAGDQAVFRVLVERHLSVVVASVQRLLADASEAEDIAQEAFVRLWQRAGELEIGEAGVRPWLRRVSRNLAIDRLRARKRLDVVAEVPELGEPPPQQAHVEDQDRAAHVAHVLATLPDRQRVALTLFHFEEMSQVEVAEALSCSVEAVESLLSRARRRLKVDLKDAWQAILDETGRAP